MVLSSIEHGDNDNLFKDRPIINYDLDLAEWQVRSVCNEISDDDSCSDVSIGPTSLRDTLADWAVTHNVSHAALSDLLSSLQPVIPSD